MKKKNQTKQPKKQKDGERKKEKGCRGHFDGCLESGYEDYNKRVQIHRLHLYLCMSFVMTFEQYSECQTMCFD